MSDPYDIPEYERAAMDRVVEALRARRIAIPTTEHITVCQSIEPDTRQFDGVLQIADRFTALTRPLPLAGADALKAQANGELAIVARLRTDIPWLGVAIDLIDDQLRTQLWVGRPWIAFRPMLLVGPPGAGKTHLARLLATRAGTGHAVFSMAGMYDASLLTGAPRSYTSPSPSFPAVAMCQTHTANPILVGDELDKVATDRRMGDPLAALLTLIEPVTARAYYDKCLLAECDLSHASWLFTANTLDRIGTPLRSRLDIVTVEGPSEAHFDALLASLTRDLASAWRISPTELPHLARGAEDVLRKRFARSRSVRALKREFHAAMATGLGHMVRALH